MKNTVMIPAGLCFLLSGLGAARADVAVGVSANLIVEPSAPIPSFAPAPPVQLPPAPVAVGYAPAPSEVVTGGQWVFTAQYGWLYMPYGSRYVVTPAAGSYAYVYYPSYGWRWLSAPWVLGTGPYPYFGARGPFAYGWYRGLHHAGHPMAVHYANLGHRPFPGPRPVVPVRPAPGAHAVGPHAPGHPSIAPRPTPSRPASVAWQRNQPRPVSAGAGRGRR